MKCIDCKKDMVCGECGQLKDCVKKNKPGRSYNSYEWVMCRECETKKYEERVGKSKSLDVNSISIIENSRRETWGKTEASVYRDALNAKGHDATGLTKQSLYKLAEKEGLGPEDRSVVEAGKKRRKKDAEKRAKAAVKEGMKHYKGK